MDTCLKAKSQVLRGGAGTEGCLLIWPPAGDGLRPLLGFRTEPDVSGPGEMESNKLCVNRTSLSPPS